MTREDAERLYLRIVENHFCYSHGTVTEEEYDREKESIISLLTTPPVPVEELKPGNYRMTVEVEIAHGPCETDLVKIGKPESTGPIMYLEWFTNETVSAVFTEAPNE